MKRVFIWGSYDFANFGDDLMALMIGVYLQAKGYEVAVFRLAEALTVRYRLSSVSSCEEGVAWCDLCVLGGGAVFGPLYGPRGVVEEYDRDIGALAESISRHARRTIALSVGVGALDAKGWTENQQRLLTCPSFLGGSVRLRRDLLHLQKTAKFVYYPDIVLAAAHVFSLPRSNPSTRTIYWNIPSRPGINWFAAKVATGLPNLFGYRAKSISAYGTYLEATRKDLITRELFLADAVPFDDPVDLLRHLANFPGIVVSTKLHLGLAAMTAGSVFISVNGKPKTREQLIEMKLSDYAVSLPSLLPRLLGFLMRPNRKYFERFHLATREMESGALQHFSLLDRHLSPDLDSVAT